MQTVDEFTAQRPRLKALAYRLLGSWSDAEDVVQDAYVRWEGRASGRDGGGVTEPGAYLARVVTNLCLDLRKSSRFNRELYVGAWLPEPVPTDAGRLGGVPVDPEQISLAFLAILERLSPLERAAYVLAEAFDFDHAEIAAVLDRAEPAVRQLLHRAREHVRAGRPRFHAAAADHERMLGAFMTACAAGDVDGLARLLAGDVVAVSDGGGKARAALRPIVGADRVARFLVATARKAPPDLAVARRELNGAPALVLSLGGRPFLVLQIETDGERVRSVAMVLNPDKLQHLG